MFSILHKRRFLWKVFAKMIIILTRISCIKDRKGKKNPISLLKLSICQLIGWSMLTEPRNSFLQCCSKCKPQHNAEAEWSAEHFMVTSHMGKSQYSHDQSLPFKKVLLIGWACTENTHARMATWNSCSSKCQEHWRDTRQARMPVIKRCRGA